MRLLPDGALEECGIDGATSVLVGLSGGADSVALLDALKVLECEGAVGPVSAAHLHHGIRGDSADRDMAFCESFCQSLHVPLMTERADVPAYAKEKGLSLEAAAREMRYAFLNRAADAAKACCIATAHHMDDQAETVLLHLARGSGMKGLCGMSPRNGNLVRPLLSVRRSEIDAYIAFRALSYCTDETNFSFDAARNRVRHGVLPALSSVNSESVRHIAEAAGRLRADEAFLCSLSDALLAESARGAGYDRKMLAAAPGPVRTRALMRLAVAGRGEVSAADVRRLDALLLARTGTRIELSRGGTALVTDRELRIGRFVPEEAFCMPFQTDGVTHTPHGYFTSQRADAFRIPETPFEAYVDLNAFPDGAEARSRRPGDWFYPLGAPGKRLLSDVLTDRKVPQHERSLPIVAIGPEVLFVPGYTVSERIRVGADSGDILHIVYTEGA